MPEQRNSPRDRSPSEGAGTGRENLEAPRPAQRRRWLRRVAFSLVVLILLLAGFVAASPYIVSQPAVARYALGFVNERIRGAVQLERLSVSWGGPTELTGLTVTDPERREVLQIGRISASGGLWQVVTSALAFGTVTIDSPRVTLFVSPQNEISLTQAFQLRRPASASEPGPPPQPNGRLTVRNGSIRLVKQDGTVVEVADLAGEVAMKSLNDLSAKLGAEALGGSIAADVAVRELFKEGQFGLSAADGAARIRTEGVLDVAPLAQFFAPELGLQGAVDLQVDAKFAAGVVTAEVHTNVRELQTRERAADGAQPIALTLHGAVNLDDRRLAAHTDLVGDAGTATADLKLLIPDQAPALSRERLASAALTGDALGLPDFALAAQADIDLAALGRAVPGLLCIRADQEIVNGTLRIDKLAVSGGSAPAALAAVRLSDVTARRGGRTAQVAPVALDFDAILTAGKGLECRRVELSSSFAKVAASGAATELRATYEADLAQLQRELGEVFDLGAFDLAGNMSGVLELARVGEERVDVKLESKAKDLRYKSPERALGLRTAHVSQAGYVALSDQKVTRYTAEQTRVSLDDEVELTGTGWYDVSQGAFQADFELQGAGVSFAARQAGGLGLEGLGRYAGELAARVRVEQAGGKQPVESTGTLVARQLRVDGQLLLDEEATVQWSGFRLNPESGQLRADSIHFDGGAAAVDARKLAWLPGAQLDVHAELNAEADVAACLAIVSRMTRAQKPPALSGRLNLRTTCSSESGVVLWEGQGMIADLGIGAGDKIIREPQLPFELVGRFDQPQDRITVSRCHVKSAPFAAEVTGTLDQVRGPCVLALSGRYDASWKELTALLHELVPATAEHVSVVGTSSSEFQVAGPLRQPDVQPPFRALRTEVGVQWASAELCGVRLAAARLAPALSDGRLMLPLAEIPAEKGRVRVGGRVDFAPADPLLQLPGRTQLIESVAITTGLRDALLSRLNPIFMFMTRIEGTASLSVEDVELPLGAALKTGGAGQGKLDLTDVRIQPSGLLTELLNLGAPVTEEMYTVYVGTVDFVIRNGRIAYDNFTLVFPGDFDLKFYGAVGFDDALDLVVSLPVKEGLLKRMGVRGPLSDYAGVLADVRVDIPIVGTRTHPQLDFSRIDVGGLVRRAVERLGGKTLEGLIPGRGGEKADTKPSEPGKLLQDLFRPPEKKQTDADPPRKAGK